MTTISATSPLDPAPKTPKKRARVPSSAAEQAAQSVELCASTGHTSSDKILPTRFNSVNSKKKGATTPHVMSCVASFASTRRSTHLLIASSTLGSGKKNTSTSKSAKGHNNESIAARPECSATAAAKALLEQLQITSSEIEDDDFEEGGGSNDDMDDDDSSGNGSDIEVMVEGGNLKAKQNLVAPAKATQKGLPTGNTEKEESSSDEDGESAC